MTLKAGDTLWYVPNNRYGRAYSVTITKIGNKWAYFDHHQRCDKNTLLVDGYGYSSPGTLHLSQEAYETAVATDADWARLRKIINREWSAPSGVTISAIHQAAGLLGFTITPEPSK